MAAALLVLPSTHFSPVAAQTSTAKPTTVRVGNLANSGELNRYIRRVRDGCGSEPGIVTENRSSEKSPGSVIGQHPPIGTRVGCDATTATLYISAGAAPPELVVPSLIEQRHRAIFEGQASEICGGPVRVTQRMEASDLPRGTFISQYPQQGARFRCGGSLTVNVSAGPPASTIERIAAAGRQKASPEKKAPEKQKPAKAEPAKTQEAETPLPAAPIPAPTAAPATTVVLPDPAPATQPEAAIPAPAAIPVPPRQLPWLWLGIGAAALLVALGLFLAGLTSLRKRPNGKPAPSPAPSAPNGQTPMSLTQGRPVAASALGPQMPADAQPVTARLPANPVVADLIGPLDSIVDWIANTTVARASAPALGSRSAPARNAGETLTALRQSITEGMSQALLFQLAPLIADAMSRAKDLPLLAGAEPDGGYATPLAPHSVIITIYPDLTVTAGGLSLFRLDPGIELRLGFDTASAVIRGHSLEALLPDSVTASARMNWLGESRPIPTLARHAEWAGPVTLSPPRLLHSLAQIDPAQTNPDAEAGTGRLL